MHRACIVITVHLEQDGVPLSFVLDLVEVPRSHSGYNMVEEFARILKEFSIEHKVGTSGAV
jgi:hypothetical protein